MTLHGVSMDNLGKTTRKAYWAIEKIYKISFLLVSWEKTCEEIRKWATVSIKRKESYSNDNFHVQCFQRRTWGAHWGEARQKCTSALFFRHCTNEAQALSLRCSHQVRFLRFSCIVDRDVRISAWRLTFSKVLLLRVQLRRWLSSSTISGFRVVLTLDLFFFFSLDLSFSRSLSLVSLSQFWAFDWMSSVSFSLYRSIPVLFSSISLSRYYFFCSVQQY